jgi:hypothetical protein
LEGMKSFAGKFWRGSVAENRFRRQYEPLLEIGLKKAA